MVVVIGGLFEALLRTGNYPHLNPRPDERSVLYRYDADLGWSPRPDAEANYSAINNLVVRHNAMGLRDGPLGGQGLPRLLVLGDSYVWGFDVTREERFTEQLEAAHPQWEVVNAGVSGYGTDQALLLLRRIQEAVAPKAVILVFTPQNDHADNASNLRYGYYKPYFTLERDSLRLRGTPSPVPARIRFKRLPDIRILRLAVDAFVRLRHPVVSIPDPSIALILQLRREIESAGAVFVVGLERAAPAVEAALTEATIPWVDLSTDARYGAYGGHWTPAGHQHVATALDQLLAREVMGWGTADSLRTATLSNAE